MSYPDDVPIVDSGDQNDTPLLKVKRIYAELYGVDITMVTDDTLLGPLFADIIMNVTFQLNVVAVGTKNTTIKELTDTIISL